MSVPVDEPAEEPCGSKGKPSKPMIFPWGSYERIFPPKTEFSEEVFSDLYDEIQDENLSTILGLIVNDTATCIGSIPISTVDLRMLWKYKLNDTKKMLLKCIPRKKKAVIPIIIKHMSFDSYYVYPLRDGLGTMFGSQTGVEAMKIDFHSNIILVDTFNKIVEHFEPHGVDDYNRKEASEMSNRILDAIRDVIPKDYRFCHSYDICPYNGPQGVARDARCYVWSMLYLHLRLKNPHMSGYQIVKEMISETAKGPPLVLDWLDVMHNTIEEVTHENSLRTGKVNKHLDLLRFRVEGLSLVDIARGLLKNDLDPKSENYEKEKKFIDMFKAGEAVILSKRNFAYISMEKKATAYSYDDKDGIIARPIPNGFRKVIS